MNFRDVETIVTVSRSQSFYEASYMLNYSPSSISKTISSMEDELGCKLFVRGNRANTASLTQEGQELLPCFIKIWDDIQELKRHMAAINADKKHLLKIGVSTKFTEKCRDEILSQFIVRNPEFSIEQSKHEFTMLIHKLYSGEISGIFLFAQEPSNNMDLLTNIMKDSKVESYILSKKSDLYLGISNAHPLAKKDEAPFIDFKDFSIAFQPDKRIIANAGIIEPFEVMSKNAGFPLKSVFLDPRDTISYVVATKQKIAIPMHTSNFAYPGIKFIKVKDWNHPSLSCFLTLKSNGGKSLADFKKFVQEYIDRENSKSI